MSYLNTWHRDYAAESILHHEKQFGAQADMIFAKFVVTCGQGAELARKAGESANDAKTVSIAQTVIDTIKSGNRYKKITSNQQYALAIALLEKHGSARGIGAAIWSLTADEIDRAE